MQASTIEPRVGAAHQITRQPDMAEIMSPALVVESFSQGHTITNDVAPETMSIHCHELARKQTGDWKRWTQQAGGGHGDEVQGTRAETATHETRDQDIRKEKRALRSLYPAERSSVG
ncbi:hypothetical protein CCUS01_00823 [Colletotrichum cuscutae]|uniref:Uncharacterized protein n=1 Tax=Colletotrichum cuscutae TaxID=1209917 RepID=A0AAI9V6S1_9PEZI|nr:hypothetical protein CCUS01_00823 [Colletotrichum cuscutae]